MKIAVELLLLIALAIIFLGGVRLRQPAVLERIDVQTTSVLKGMAILIIMVHHMVLRMSGAGLLLPFRGIGYLGVTIFFFCSGYGMTVSASKKGASYTDGFLIKRLLLIYVPAAFVNTLYMLILSLFFDKNYTCIEWCSGIFLMVDVDSSMWYIIAAFVWYAAFWIGLRFRTPNRRIAFLLVVSVVYIAVCLLMKLTKNWVDTAFMFPLGTAVASYQDKALQKCSSCRLTVWLPVMLILCGSCMALSFGKEDYGSLILRILSTFLFMAALLLLLRVIDFSGNKSCAYIGTITLECYLIHGKIIRLIKLYFGHVEAAEMLIYVAGTMLCTAIFCWLYQRYKKAMTALNGKERN